MKILLGVCGGIAAYKAAELTREFRRGGATVQVIMTANAERFVTPLTFAALSGNQVMTSLWQPINSDVAADESGTFDIEHIHVGQDADVLVIAPATANFIATLAHGFANDLLSAVSLATTLPIVIAPAMNSNMWAHPATQANLETLRQRNVQIIEPGSGELACGMMGAGRLAEPIEIANRVFQIAQQGTDLMGETVLITAGGTREPIDAVRFIGNRSSGKMGFALAAAARARGAEVILISASTTLPVPAGCTHIRVTTGAQMEQTALAELPRASMVIMAAAVSDYQVLSPSAQKIKKTETLTLELTRTPDILRQIVQQRRAGTVVVGFAAETEHVVEEGRRKLREKGADLIVANDVSRAGSGFDADHNAGTLIFEAGQQVIPLSTKREMAERILNSATSIARQLRGKAELAGSAK
ncbi:phosphopantothenoylcysteine decarboxylase/phosphopantothenate--cysteine ligase [Terriglobus roseus DSM 18391]|uniref:Coenzyme A biosynthesis bifunctional protein CoaBC n=1 Tax=Terriglobus roseus (strain DSM 18391 / NRRL B-41598 / KBS 63) TaxID=926566 RepID=I3ZIP3_TERRK|nr:bifunctional phosphopantothenoylcysteine decarboxylase/phosphopantothenate--cysteine ligase CoaBC [Terriglobus roseus]AFL89111.1 phosphopantothenoylcysteine decarboxylase/phosphopantothenate--cysteine ligase [Terriglobus roseus DSM 18391]